MITSNKMGSKHPLLLRRHCRGLFRGEDAWAQDVFGCCSLSHTAMFGCTVPLGPAKYKGESQVCIEQFQCYTVGYACLSKEARVF